MERGIALRAAEMEALCPHFCSGTQEPWETLFSSAMAREVRLRPPGAEVKSHVGGQDLTAELGGEGWPPKAVRT